MYLTIAVLVFLLFAIPGGMYWLLRPRKDMTSGPFHSEVDGQIGSGDTGGHYGDVGGHP